MSDYKCEGKRIAALRRQPEKTWMWFLLAVCLVPLPNTCQAQTQEDPQQSLAEAAHSARQRQKSTIPARVLNNEDAPSKVAADDHSISDQQLRTDLDRGYRPPLNTYLAKAFQIDAEGMAVWCCIGDPDIAFAATKALALGEYLEVPFPGRSEWEDQLRNVLDDLADERRKLPDAIHPILDANRALIDSGSTSPDALTRLEQVRQQLISAMIPERRCQARLGQLQRAGKAQAEAYRKSPNSAQINNQVTISPAAGDHHPVTDSPTRAVLEKGFPPPLNTRSAKEIQDNAELTAFVYSHPDTAFTIQKGQALREYYDVAFPGRSEWEDQLRNVVDNLADEAKKLPELLRSIENSNRALIDSGDLSREARASLKAVRQQLIDAMIPEATWQIRLAQLQQDGKSRAKAYLANHSDAMARYRQGRVPLAEEWVGSGLIWLGRAQQEYHKAYGHYTCDLQDFKFASNPGPHSANLLTDNLTEYQNYDYALTIQGCESSQGQRYQAAAVAPSSDGTQGHSFCSDDSGAVRIGPDGQADSCLSRGQPWQPKGWKP